MIRGPIIALLALTESPLWASDGRGTQRVQRRPNIIVVTVEGTAVTVTHTDVHGERARFFTSLLDRFPARWSGLDRQNAKGIGEDGGFYLITGNYDGESVERRDVFLEALGAALVFLIDWKKARKDLRALAAG